MKERENFVYLDKTAKLVYEVTKTRQNITNERTISGQVDTTMNCIKYPMTLKYIIKPHGLATFNVWSTLDLKAEGKSQDRWENPESAGQILLRKQCISFRFSKFEIDGQKSLKEEHLEGPGRKWALQPRQ